MPTDEYIDELRKENAEAKVFPIFRHIDGYLESRGWRIDRNPADPHDVMNYGFVYYAPDGTKVGGWHDAVDRQCEIEMDEEKIFTEKKDEYLRLIMGWVAAISSGRRVVAVEKEVDYDDGKELWFIKIGGNPGVESDWELLVQVHGRIAHECDSDPEFKIFMRRYSVVLDHAVLPGP